MFDQEILTLHVVVSYALLEEGADGIKQAADAAAESAAAAARAAVRKRAREIKSAKEN